MHHIDVCNLVLATANRIIADPHYVEEDAENLTIRTMLSIIRDKINENTEQFEDLADLRSFLLLNGTHERSLCIMILNKAI